MEKGYVLRLYDTDLLSFTLSERGIEGLKAQIHSVNEEARALFPLDLELTDDGLVKWLQRRVIPKNRAYVAEILKTFGLSVNDTKGIIDVCKGLSLNDSYWVVPQGFTGTFAQYNLYENRFSEILSLVAYTGIGQSDAAFTTSPELTTNGMLPKAWRFIEGEGIYLYKGGTFGAANTGNEPYSEFYASQVAQAMGLDAVAYELENWKGILASRCKLFTDIDTSYIPIGRIVRKGGLKACLEYYRQLGPEAYEQVRSMLVFDAVIYNEDRHFGNFGVLRDNHTGKVTGAAPVFDNGMSLFNFAMPEDFQDLDAYAKTRGTAYGVSFESVCQEVMGPVQVRQLRKLIGFTFRRHLRLNWPEYRLMAIERHLQKRVRQFLDMIPKLDRKQPKKHVQQER
ncbi:XRE family transcriptional regulator [Dysosmobacter sp.]|uniref:XRE family transcriptional regulator n=1 Tax=Dysosmobacter sp. TaxID=2591382 RepID=UPI003AB6A228